MLDGDGIALALWLRQRYFCTLFEAVKTILPAGLWYQIREVWHLAEGMDRCAADGMAAGIRRAVPVLDALFAAGGTAELQRLEAACGKDGWHCAAGTAEGRRSRSARPRPSRKIGDKSRRMVELAVSAEEAASLTEKRSSPQRREAVRLLAAEGRMSAAEVCYFTGVSMAVLRGLEKAGIVAFSEEEALRLPDLHGRWSPAARSSSMRNRRRPFSLSWTLTKTGQAGGGAAPGRHRQRQDPGLSPSGPGNTEPGTAGHGPGAGDRADAPDDAAVLRLFRRTRWPCSTAPCG